MPEQITWTHVDKLTSRLLDERGMMHVGNTDPEVTYNLLQFLDTRLKAFQRDVEIQEERCDRLEVELSKLRNAPKSKTKQRLAKLEEQVSEMQQRLERNCI